MSVHFSEKKTYNINNYLNKYFKRLGKFEYSYILEKLYKVLIRALVTDAPAFYRIFFYSWYTTAVILKAETF